MPQLFDERLRLRLRFDEDPEDEREDPDFEDAAREDPDLEDAALVVRRRGRSVLSSSLSSSSSSVLPKSFSLTPSSAPWVFDFAPPEVSDSISCGRPSDESSALMSRRFTASANRRYVSTLAITMRASIVSSS